MDSMKSKNIFLLILLLICATVFAAAIFIYITNSRSLETMQQAQISTQTFFENARASALFEKPSLAPPDKTAAESNTDAYETYISENGITFVSYSQKWSRDNLALLYEELLSNTHGNEMDYLKEIVIYPDS